MAPARILLVEDKDSLRLMLRHALEAHGYAVEEARDEAEALQALHLVPPAVVLTDLRLPVGDGLGVLRGVKELDPDIPVVVMTAFGGIEDAVAAMKAGALDFLAKPVDLDHLALLIERALAQRRLVTENFLLKAALAERQGAPRIGHQHDGPAGRRERDGQGAVCPRAASSQSARRRAVCRHQLRGDSGNAARERTLRP
jgi:DNA-binding NtrC family response regulator